jgi:hypothetical protein
LQESKIDDSVNNNCNKKKYKNITNNNMEFKIYLKELHDFSDFSENKIISKEYSSEKIIIITTFKDTIKVDINGRPIGKLTDMYKDSGERNDTEYKDIKLNYVVSYLNLACIENEQEFGNINTNYLDTLNLLNDKPWIDRLNVFKKEIKTISFFVEIINEIKDYEINSKSYHHTFRRILNDKVMISTSTSPLSHYYFINNRLLSYNNNI